MADEADKDSQSAPLVLNGNDEFNTEDETETTGAETLPPYQPRYHFGCGPCHPRWLQVFADPKVFTFCLCLFALVEGATVSGEEVSVVMLSTVNQFAIMYRSQVTP